MKVAIHSVFILKENILFLEEWIDYHISIGFEKFYLYDNSKVSRLDGWDLRHKDRIKFGQVNKYQINYDKIVNMTDNEMKQFIKKLCEKYKCIDIIEWSPKDDDGYILYNQNEAHNHCLKRLKKDNIDWCANIDMDEYIVLNKNNKNIRKFIKNRNANVSNIAMGQILYDSRFNNMGKSIVNINKIAIDQPERTNSNKNLYRVEKTNALSVHGWEGNGKKQAPPLQKICFNHYKINVTGKYKQASNIANIIKLNIERRFYNTYLEVKYNKY
jgi:hypothetical protein